MDMMLVSIGAKDANYKCGGLLLREYEIDYMQQRQNGFYYVRCHNKQTGKYLIFLDAQFI